MASTDSAPTATDDVLAGRHPSVAGVARFLLDVNPNLTGEPARIAREFAAVARWLLRSIDDSAELAAGLRKLIEAKDCACRAALPPRGEG